MLTKNEDPILKQKVFAYLKKNRFAKGSWFEYERAKKLIKAELGIDWERYRMTVKYISEWMEL